MRGLLGAAVLLACALASRAAAGDPPSVASPPGPRTSGPTTIADLARALTETQERLEALTARAQRDLDWDTVEAYRARTKPEDFRRRGDLDLVDVVKIWSDPTNDAPLREAAFQASTSTDALRHDLDLQFRGQARNKFAVRNVVRLLDTKQDPATRRFANRWLVHVFPSESRSDPALLAFEPETCTSRQSDEVQRAWTRALR